LAKTCSQVFATKLVNPLFLIILKRLFIRVIGYSDLLVLGGAGTCITMRGSPHIRRLARCHTLERSPNWGWFTIFAVGRDDSGMGRAIGDMAHNVVTLSSLLIAPELGDRDWLYLICL